MNANVRRFCFTWNNYTEEAYKKCEDFIYTERKDGILPAYDIRTDRWDIAQAAMEINQKAISAKRQRDYDGFVEGEKKNLNSGNNEINQDPENSGAA